MPFRTKVQREDRRRRIIRDEASLGTTAETATPSAAAGGGSGGGRTYSDAAVASVQLRLAELVPYRVWSLWVCWLTGMVAVALIPALYVYQQTGGQWAAPRELDALSPIGLGTLASWMASMFLAFASVLAGLIFFVRRHKQDDYRGRYGLWLWVSVALMLGSIDASTSLHRLICHGIGMFTEVKLYGDGTIWWVVVVSVVGGLLGLQVVIDGRRSWGTWASLLMAAVCYAGAAVLYLSVFDVGDYGQQTSKMAQGGVLLWAHYWLLFSMLLQTRFVVMDAQGMVAVKPAKLKKSRAAVKNSRGRGLAETKREPRPTRKPATDAKEPASLSGSSAAGSRRQVAARNMSQKENKSAEDLELELMTDPSITKTDRKRLMKELRRQKRAA